MRKSIKYILFLIVLVGVSSCTKEQLLTDSVIDTSKPQLNATDLWIRTNYTEPYNVEVLYKWNDGEATPGKNLVPPKEELVIPFMQMLDSVFIKPYITEGGVDFFRKLTPKQFLLIGSPSYNTDGTRTQGTAEGGRKIVLYSLNWFNPKDKQQLWDEYIHVVFHEFGHIMHQTISHDPDYMNIVPGYTAVWFGSTDAEAREKGFITAYSLSGPDEDFVEIMSIFITTSPAYWDGLIASVQDAKAKAAIIKKLDVVVKYMKSAWNIDAYSLRTTVNASIDRVVNNAN